MKQTLALARLGPLEQLRAGRLARRLVQLLVGLALYGLSMALMIRGNLGLPPWDAFHMGITRHLPVSFGAVVIAVSFCVLLLWIPLREIPGIGTIANSLIIGTVAGFTLPLLHAPGALAARVAFMAGGIVLCALATALYIGAQLGRGPRDGLMTGLHRVTGLSLRSVRTGLEAIVLLAGLALGGVGLFGIGTVLFAAGIGPLTQAMLKWTLVELEAPSQAAEGPLSPAATEPQAASLPRLVVEAHPSRPPPASTTA